MPSNKKSETMSWEVTNNFIKSMECRKLTKSKVIQVFFPKNNKKFQMNNLTHHLQELEKEEQTKPKEIVKIRKWKSLSHVQLCIVHGIL